MHGASSTEGLHDFLRRQNSRTVLTAIQTRRLRNPSLPEAELSGEILVQRILQTSAAAAQRCVANPGTTPASTSKAGRISLQNFAWFTLAYNVAVVLWGAYVRSTGSGAGCGNHWPLCNGEFLPVTSRARTVIALTRRAPSGFSLVLVATLLI